MTLFAQTGAPYVSEATTNKYPELKHSEICESDCGGYFKIPPSMAT